MTESYDMDHITGPIMGRIAEVIKYSGLQKALVGNPMQARRKLESGM